MEWSFWIDVWIVQDRIRLILHRFSAWILFVDGEVVDRPKPFVAVLVGPHAHVNVVIHHKFFQAEP